MLVKPYWPKVCGVLAKNQERVGGAVPPRPAFALAGPAETFTSTKLLPLISFPPPFGVFSELLSMFDFLIRSLLLLGRPVRQWRGFTLFLSSCLCHFLAINPQPASIFCALYQCPRLAPTPSSDSRRSLCFYRKGSYPISKRILRRELFCFGPAMPCPLRHPLHREKRQRVRC